MTTYGEVSWDDKSAGFSNSESKGSDVFLRLKNGPNPIRLATKPQQYIVHEGVKREGDKGYGTKVLCSKVHGSCPLCEAGYGVRPRWFLGVIDRESNSYKVLDISSSVFFDIKALNAGRWGDPKNYDIDIIKNDKADPQHYYSVQPIERAPLSASDQKILDEQMDLDFLKKKITPPTVEQTEKRLEKILEGGKLAAPVKKESKKTNGGSAKSASTSPTTATVATPSATDADELDDIFPSHDAETVSS
jgi:hypothetical protein